MNQEALHMEMIDNINIEIVSGPEANNHQTTDLQRICQGEPTSKPIEYDQIELKNATENSIDQASNNKLQVIRKAYENDKELMNEKKHHQEEDECAICLVSIEKIPKMRPYMKKFDLSCGHGFHIKCLLPILQIVSKKEVQWLLHFKCPICRQVHVQESPELQKHMQMQSTLRVQISQKQQIKKLLNEIKMREKEIQRYFAQIE